MNKFGELILEKVNTIIASINSGHLSKTDAWKNACFTSADRVLEELNSILKEESWPARIVHARDKRQLADWLLTDPVKSEPLTFASPPENTGAWTRVRMRNSSGDDWTLTARLAEGWLTTEQRGENLQRAIDREMQEMHARAPAVPEGSIH